MVLVNLNPQENIKRTLPNIYDGTKEPTLLQNSAHVQPIREVSSTIQILNEDGSVFDTISGVTTAGSINVSNMSLIRRTGSLTMVLDKKYLPDTNTATWYGKKFRLYQGITNRTTGEEVNYLLGTFIVDQVALNVDTQSQSIDIALSDKMTKYDTIGLEKKLKLPNGTPINVAIKSLMESVGETEFGYIEESESNEIVPFDYEKDIGTKVIDIITELRDMYMDYYCGYNLLGQFEFRRMNIQKEDTVTKPKWEFDSTQLDRADLTLSFNEAYNLHDVYNRIVVFGATSSVTGETPRGESKITDASNKFNIDAIGVRTQVVVDTNLNTDIQCVSEAKYQIYKTAHFAEQATITTVPIYTLDVDDIITITNPVTKEINRYKVASLSFTLDINGTMTITADKLYYVGLEYGATERPLVTAIKNGFGHLGWLSAGEERIKQIYGISGSGDNRLVVRFTNDKLGGTQASVTGYKTSTTQTLEMDLADFANLDVNSEDGDVRRSTGDYLDRVLAHEMFHAVCNDYLTVTKTADIPVWWKEGFAEEVHGIRERYTSLVGYSSNTDKKNSLINKAKAILNGEWTSASIDYVGASLIAIALYELVGNDGIKKSFQYLHNSENLNLNFLAKAYPTLGDTNAIIIPKIINQLQISPAWGWLNDMTDTDTVSIGGYHMDNLYGTPLNAHSVIPNGNNDGVLSLGFKVEFNE